MQREVVVYMLFHIKLYVGRESSLYVLPQICSCNTSSLGIREVAYSTP